MRERQEEIRCSCAQLRVAERAAILMLVSITICLATATAHSETGIENEKIASRSIQQTSFGIRQHTVNSLSVEALGKGYPKCCSLGGTFSSDRERKCTKRHNLAAHSIKK